jgi:hypothetical protein
MKVSNAIGTMVVVAVASLALVFAVIGCASQQEQDQA